jgi:hypothetical protein
MVMVVEIKVYGKGTKYNSKRCSCKVVKEIYSIKPLNNREVKELEKTLSDGDYDPYHEYYKIMENDGELNYYRASHTKITIQRRDLLLNKYDVLFSKDYYKHHTATAKNYLRSSDDGMVEEYSGRFGDGYIIHRQMNSSKYHLIEYYIKKGE